jgi:hypothetical protein
MIKTTFVVEQNGRSQRNKLRGTGYSWGWKEERKPRKRWQNDVEDDLRKIRVKRWRINAMDRTEWKKICEAAKVLQEL